MKSTISQFSLLRFFHQAVIPYIHSGLRPDLVAGLTVAMVVGPQSMAYAGIAGISPIYGIYTAILPAIIASLFGSSSQLSTGPTNAVALVTLGVLVAKINDPRYPEYVFALAVLCGLLLLLMGVFRLGVIIRFVSNAVLTGFLGAASILIIIYQLGNLIGLSIPQNQSTLSILGIAAANLFKTNIYVLITSLFTGLVMLVCNRINKKIPAMLLAVILAGLLVYLSGWNLKGVKLVLNMGLPVDPGLAFHIPQVSITEMVDMLPGAGAVSLLILVQTLSIAKAVSLSTYQRINPSREFVGQGLACLAGGFSMSFPSAGSLTRTAVNFNSGAKTRLSGVFSGLLIWLALVISINLIGYIPVAALAVVVVFSAISLIDVHHIRLTWKTRSISRLVMLVTFATTIFFPLEKAVYFGALLSIAIYLYESRRLNLSYLTVNPEGKFVERSLDDLVKEHPQIAIVNIEGNVYFGAVDDLENKMDLVIQAGIKVLILRMRHMRLIASTGIAALEGIIMQANHAGTRILICGVREELEKTFISSGISTLIGEDCIFKAGDVLFASVEQALEKAKRIIETENSIHEQE